MLRAAQTLMLFGLLAGVVCPAAPLCVPAPLAVFMSQGSCDIGEFTFGFNANSFSSAGTTQPGALTPDTIVVLPFSAPSQVGVIFTGSQFGAAEQFLANYIFAYTVTGSTPLVSETLILQNATTGPNGFYVAVKSANGVASVLSGVGTSSPLPNIFTDTQALPPATTLNVTDQVFLAGLGGFATVGDGGANPGAVANIFGVSAIPEPVTMASLGSGLLALALLRVLRR